MVHIASYTKRYFIFSKRCYNLKSQFTSKQKLITFILCALLEPNEVSQFPDDSFVAAEAQIRFNKINY